MNEDLRKLVEQGLREENLRKLALLCKDLFAEAACSLWYVDVHISKPC